jgi:protein gp37
MKTKIEWCDYTINPVKGLCPMACPYCYARKMYKRFKWNPEIRLEVDSFLPFLTTIKIKPSKIFIGSTMEIFGDWVKPEWMQFIFDRVKLLPEHTFIFLTKQPWNLAKWEFPENCWAGVSVTSAKDAIIRIPKFKDITTPIKFISFEPLLKPIASPNQLYIMLKLSGINWIIIGQQTPSRRSTTPRIEWIQEIVQAADKAGVPVFEKDNLAPLLNRPLRREFPKVLSTGGR